MCDHIKHFDLELTIVFSAYRVLLSTSLAKPNPFFAVIYMGYSHLALSITELYDRDVTRTDSNTVEFFAKIVKALTVFVKSSI